MNTLLTEFISKFRRRNWKEVFYLELITIASEFITTVGFPIAVTCYSLYLLNKNDERNDAEKKELYSYINENTKVLQKLCDELEKGEIV